MTETYRVDHIGSLLRPPELLRSWTAHDQGRIGPDELRQIEDRSIVDILTMQRKIGLDVVSDGEYRRAGWMGRFWESVEGFVQHPVTRTTIGRDGPSITQMTHPVVAAKLRSVPRGNRLFSRRTPESPTRSPCQARWSLR